MQTHDLTELVERLTAHEINNLKRMIELGKKPDGQRLSDQDRQSCMTLVLLWEAKHIPETERSGYIDQPCKNTKKVDSNPHDAERPVNLYV